MNKQKTKTGRGIEWCDYTWNPISGCQHGCAWTMPDGSVANCYAEDVANRVAQKAYPMGFEHHYWKPDLLWQPGKIDKLSRIFVGSMADVFGHWTPAEQVEDILQACGAAFWHTFIFLTKNAPRLQKFHFPSNCHVGISAPPSEMMGKPLSRYQQDKWFASSLNNLARCDAKVKWVSFEPLSYDITNAIRGHTIDIQWAVIGAASNGKKIYQPEPQWVRNLIVKLDSQGTPVFFKGNLKGNEGVNLWREELPEKA